MREEAGLSGSEVARSIGWSQPKLSRIETGRFGASLHELALLLDFYGVAEEVRAELLARTARRGELGGAWVVRAGGSRRRQSEVGAVESRVERLQQYQMATIPGLLQVPAYTRAVAAAMGLADTDAIAERRAERQADFRSRDAVPYEVVLDARALTRWPGLDSVMVDQLSHLTALDQQHLVLRVLPDGSGAQAVAMSSFLIYTFPNEQPAVVMSEAQTADLYLSDEGDVAAFRGLFERLVNEALSVEETQAYLRRRLRSLRNRSDHDGEDRRGQ
ncbi:helix-turn-helix domain-containing protein [Luteipulveratus mongoliensis]|uniref:HTH cro/C1-type domain-containing protein n=1 Tax=Luteipulveratus mongoliensis TaxID=571913 RepID=A0A0K1JDR9_9MICO|nr:hypothetical protein VV02_01540 [Luteipulveratus mongoliensis]